MSMDKVFEKINDEALGAIAGGMSRNLKAAYDEQKASLAMDANHTNYEAYGVKSWLEVHNAGT